MNGKVTKVVARMMARNRENDVDIVRVEETGDGALREHVGVGVEPGPEPPFRPENEHVDQAADDGRDPEREVDECDKERAAPEVEAGERPGRGEAEEGVQRHRDRGGEKGQPDRVLRVFVAEGRENTATPFEKAS